MKIVSKFTDYYDSVQSLGMDKSCVYVRKAIPFSMQSGSPILELIENHLHVPSNIFFYPKNRNQVNDAMKLERFLVGYCGILLLGYKFSHFSNEKEIKTNFFYHPLKAKQYIHKQMHKFPTYNNSYMYEQGETRNFSFSEENYQYIQSLSGIIAEFFQKIQSPVFLYPESISVPETLSEAKNKSYYYFSYNPEVNFLLNPRLKAVEFFRYKNPYTCYQDIYQFLSGVLTKREDIDTPMTEKDKVNQHGFDETYGFRTRPGSKKKKKKKKS